MVSVSGVTAFDTTGVPRPGSRDITGEKRAAAHHRRLGSMPGNVFYATLFSFTCQQVRKPTISC
jgi:hypothetical protein